MFDRISKLGYLFLVSIPITKLVIANVAFY